MKLWLLYGHRNKDQVWKVPGWYGIIRSQTVPEKYFDVSGTVDLDFKFSKPPMVPRLRRSNTISAWKNNTIRRSQKVKSGLATALQT